LTIGLGAVLALSWWALRVPPEPVYQNKTVTAWAREVISPDPNIRSNATVALQTLGTKAIPSLVRNLQRRDSVLRNPFLSLGGKMPLWVRRRFCIP